MSWSARLALLVGQRLNAVGQIIASELERSYPGPTGYIVSPERKAWKSPVGLLRQVKWQSKRSKLDRDSVLSDGAAAVAPPES